MAKRIARTDSLTKAEEDKIEMNEYENMAEQEQEFDYDALLEGVAPAPEFIDWATGVFYMRPIEVARGVKYNEDEQPILIASIRYQVVGSLAATPEHEAMQNGLLSEQFRLGGAGVQATEKMSAEGICRLNQEKFLARVRSLGVDLTHRPREEAYQNRVELYAPEEERCIKVSIKVVADKKGYINVRQFRVLDLDVPIDNVPGAENYTPYYKGGEADN